jgi:sugar lactone lactonase YvrE
MVLVFWAMFLVGSCAVEEGAVRFEQIGRVWPDSVDPARIAYVGEFSNAADLENALVRPMDVAATPDAQIVFVADPDAGCVHRYDLGRRKYQCLASGRGESNVSVVGVTVTEDGHLFATDSMQGGIWQAGPKDTKLTPFYTSEGLVQPTGIHWRPDTQRQTRRVTGCSSMTVPET